MAKVVVLVNGLPGAGKTTLAAPLAARLGLPLLAKDALKETMADVLGSVREGQSQRAWSQLLGAAAMESIWTLLAVNPIGALIDANLPPAVRPLAVAGLERAGVDPAELIEVWCEVSLASARARFEQRAELRHPVHGVQVGLVEHWASLDGQARPLGLGRVITVDTLRPVDLDGLVAAIDAIQAIPTIGESSPAP